MKPAFALSLSIEGISLQHRAAGGWQMVGEVALDDPDLTGALAALRGKALLLEPEVHCKLILPDDQVRYLSVETGGFEGDALIHIIEGAVDSATPYDIDDLIYDTAPGRETTHVAVVARETLAEAENFAAEHGFLPVSFVALPHETGFPGEPFFGPSQIAQGWTGSQAVEPDASVVVDIGPAVLPDPPPEPEDDSPAPSPVAETPPAPVEDPEPLMHEGEDTSPPTEPEPSQSEDATPIRPQNMADPEQGLVDAPAKPRRTGLILTLLLLAILVLAGLLATVFLDNPTDTQSDSDAEPVVATDSILTPSEAQPLPDDSVLADPETPTETEEAIADLIDVLPAPTEIPTLSETDAAVLDALAEEDLQEVEAIPEIELLDPEELYAETGLWSVTPAVPETPGPVTLDDLYVASIDRTDLSQDPIALPATAQLETDLRVVVQTAPAIAEAGFDLDERGLVEPTPEGARSPDGILIYLGKPPKLPPETPLRFEAEPEVDETREVLAQKRPRLRPENLQELNQRARLGGRSLVELSGIRPKARPATLNIQEQIEEIVASVELVDPVPRPRLRPQGLTAGRQQNANLGSLANLDRQTQVKAVAPRVVTPSRPSPTSVARQATVKNALSLRKVSLIGVFGTPSSRRALVRMPNGRYKKVKVGDRVDGGRVVAIGDSELRYQKSGRNLTLKMPKG